jgi:hypothetical protein
MSDLLEELTTDIAAVRKRADERLTVLHPPVAGLLSAIRLAANHMRNARSTLQTKLSRLRQDASLSDAARQVAEARTRGMQLAAPDRRVALQSEIDRVHAEAAQKLYEKAVEGGRENAQKIADRVVGAAQQLEAEVAKLALDSSPLGGVRDIAAAPLQKLLADERVLADLESRSMQEIAAFWRNSRMVDSELAQRLEGPIGRIARKRVDPYWVREQARRRVQGGRDGHFEQDQVEARKLLYELEAARKQRLPVDYEIFETEFRPALAGLLRRTIGIDPRTLNEAERSRYLQTTFKVGATLNEQPVRDGWPLRYLVDRVPPQARPRQALPGVVA